MEHFIHMRSGTVPACGLSLLLSGRCVPQSQDGLSWLWTHDRSIVLVYGIDNQVTDHSPYAAFVHFLISSPRQMCLRSPQSFLATASSRAGMRPPWTMILHTGQGEQRQDGRGRRAKWGNGIHDQPKRSKGRVARQFCGPSHYVSDSTSLFFRILRASFSLSPRVSTRPG